MISLFEVIICLLLGALIGFLIFAFYFTWRIRSYNRWKSKLQRNKKYHLAEIPMLYIDRVKFDREFSMYEDRLGVYFIKDKQHCPNCGSYNTEHRHTDGHNEIFVCHSCQKIFDL